MPVVDQRIGRYARDAVPPRGSRAILVWLMAVDDDCRRELGAPLFDLVSPADREPYDAFVMGIGAADFVDNISARVQARAGRG